MSTTGDWTSGSGSITIPRLVNMRGSYLFQYLQDGVTPIATSGPVTFKDATEITQVCVHVNVDMPAHMRVCMCARVQIAWLHAAVDERVARFFVAGVECRQVHLALGESVTETVVSWTSFDSDGHFVSWGLSPSNLSTIAAATT
jgi:hypothetical protein